MAASGWAGLTASAIWRARCGKSSIPSSATPQSMLVVLGRCGAAAAPAAAACRQPQGSTASPAPRAGMQLSTSTTGVRQRMESAPAERELAGARLLRRAELLGELKRRERHLTAKQGDRGMRRE